MAFDPVKNFAKCTVSVGYSSTDNQIVLVSGHGDRLPDPFVDGAFNLVWYNSSDYGDPADDPYVEVIRCTVRDADTLTVLRAQEDTEARDHNLPNKRYKLILAPTQKKIEDLEAAIDENTSKRVDTWTAPLAYSSTTKTASLGYKPTQFQVEDNLLSLYVPPTVTLTGGSINEIGSIVSDVALEWTCNKQMISRNLSSPVPFGDRARGAGQNGNYTHTGANLTTNTVYSITVNDGANVTSSTTTVEFRNKRYRGTNSAGSLSNEQILALTGQLAVSREREFFQDGNGQYIYVAYPSAWGEATFKVNGLLSTDWTLMVQNHTNAYGYEEEYYIYRTNSIQYGTGIHIEII